MTRSGILLNRRRGASWLPVLLLIAAAACSDQSQPTADTNRLVTKILIDPQELDFPAIGETAPLKAELVDGQGSVVPVGAVTWSVADASVALVDNSGTVRATGNGTTVVIATAGGKKDTTQVRVRQQTANMSISPGNQSFTALGDTVRFKANLQDRGGYTISSGTVAWSVGDASVATVDSTGLVRARANGQTVLIATSGTMADTAAVQVSQQAASVAVSPPSGSVKAGSSLQLSASATDKGGTPVANASFAWVSSAPSVATVDASGLVRGVAAGQATISASSGSATGTATLTVAAAAPASLAKVSGDGQSAAASSPLASPLVVKVLDATGNPASGVTVSWVAGSGMGSASPASSTTDAQGQAQTTWTLGSTAGGQQLAAQVSGLTSVTFSATAMTSGAARVVISPDSATLAVGTSLMFSASGQDQFGNALSSFVWSSLDPTIAKAETSGRVIALAAGRARVVATAGGKADTAIVTVSQSSTSATPTPARVVVKPDTATVGTGSTLQLSATVYDAQSAVISGATVSWKTLSAAVATVDLSGKVTALATGTAKIVGTAGTVADTSTITVPSQPVQSPAPPPPTGSAGELVTYPSPEVAFILGPQLKAGSASNPWPWFDQNAASKGAFFGSRFPSAPPTDPNAADQYINQNYYDLGLTMYLEYYRTGDTQYLNYARKIADSWWQSGPIANGTNTNFDNGYAPRNASLGGLMLRALDGRPEMWPWITQYVRYEFGIWVGNRVSYNALYYGVRDGGYMLLYAAWLSQVHPDPAVRAEFQQKALDAAVNYYARLQNSDGSWRWVDDVANSTTPVMQPFMVGLLLDGLVAVHRITGNATVAQAITKSVTNIYNTAYRATEPVTGVNAYWRGMWYFLYGDSCASGCGRTTLDGGWDTNGIREVRQLNSTIVHAFGYAYKITGNTQYRTWGDEIFAATYGRGTGPLSDAYGGLADYLEKEYNQAYRSGGHYLVWRTGQ